MIRTDVWVVKGEMSGVGDGTEVNLRDFSRAISSLIWTEMRTSFSSCYHSYELRTEAGEQLTSAGENSGLYWHGGPRKLGIEYPGELSTESLSTARGLMEEFCLEIQKLYFFYQCACEGLMQQRKLYERFITTETLDRTVFIGGSPPDQEQMPGHSTLARMGQGELLQSLEAGGPFENYQAKYLVVMIYHLWDEFYRPKIARALSVETRRVKCTLMGDIRKVRHLIIHENSVVPENFLDDLEFLPQIWELNPGELTISGRMVSSWIEQLNAISVKVDAEIS